MSGKRGKKDAAICEAVQRPAMRFVPVKSNGRMRWSQESANASLQVRCAVLNFSTARMCATSSDGIHRVDVSGGHASPPSLRSLMPPELAAPNVHRARFLHGPSLREFAMPRSPVDRLHWCSSAPPRRAAYVVAWDEPSEITKPSCLGLTKSSCT